MQSYYLVNSNDSILHVSALIISLLELLLAPFVPSNTARGGGIVLPVVQSIANTLGSNPELNPEIGGFLFLVGNHANFLSASMYLTGKLNICICYF